MNFIEEIKQDAQIIGHANNILPSLIMAQGILESDYGKSYLATAGHNLFGVKGDYNGESLTLGTTEYKDGHPYHTTATFRKYPSWKESFEDLCHLYTNGVTWNRELYHNVVGEKNYKKAAHNVQEDGYATDPNYAAKLIKVIESEKLTQFDEQPAPVHHTEQDPSKVAIVPYPGHYIEVGVQDKLNVERVQRAINNAQIGEHLVVDGIFGEKTKDGVEKYQASKQLQVDGIVGEQTWNMLF